MQISPSTVKILNSEFETLVYSEKWLSLLLEGKFYEFENLLHERVTRLYDRICEELIASVAGSVELIKVQKELAISLGCKKLEFRPANVQLRSGKKIRYDSLYAKKVPKDYEGSRHMSLAYWSSKDSSSPTYKSLTCLLSVICPSFMVSGNILEHLGIHANYDRVRDLSLSLGEDCLADRAEIQLASGESLAGKRVMIGIDGGRTRTRVYKEEKESKREQKFSTPWREPKMFVITTLDKEGKPEKDTLPIYDSGFGDDETYEILEQYLRNLQVEKAESVQIIADGAPWIWNRAKPMFLRLGVAEDKIIETLDYYHAMEHLHELKAYIDQEKQDSIFVQLKQQLWEGNIEGMIKLTKEGIPDVDLKAFTPFKYFVKHKKRIGYQLLKEQGRPIGSGVIESGIRRIINLRFKSPSTFWYPENVEKLILMRGIALSGRWKIMMENLTKPKR